MPGINMRFGLYAEKPFATVRRKGLFLHVCRASGFIEF